MSPEIRIGTQQSLLLLIILKGKCYPVLKTDETASIQSS